GQAAAEGGNHVTGARRCTACRGDGWRHVCGDRLSDRQARSPGVAAQGPREESRARSPEASACADAVARRARKNGALRGPLFLRGSAAAGWRETMSQRRNLAMLGLSAALCACTLTGDRPIVTAAIGKVVEGLATETGQRQASETLRGLPV